MLTLLRTLPLLGMSLTAMALAAPAAADPVRITVSFTVSGDPRDPDLGGATSSGRFSVVTTLPPETRTTIPEGFGADDLLFTWGDVSWTTADADVVQLGFDASGRLDLWTLAGMTAGSAIQSTAWPDFAVSFCGFCDPGLRNQFLYTTARSGAAGIFTGSLDAFTAESDAVVTPEPTSMLLVGSGIAGLLLKRRRDQTRASR